MKCLALIVSIAATTLLTMSPAIAAGLRISPDTVGIGFFSDDDPGATEVDPESLAFRIACPAATPDGSTGPTLLIMSADQNEAAALQILKDGEADGATAVFQSGAHTIKAPLTGYAVTVDGMNGGWDLTLNLQDAEPLTGLGPLARSGPLKLKIGKSTYDLTPRDADRHVLVAALAKCGASR